MFEAPAGRATAVLATVALAAIAAAAPAGAATAPTHRAHGSLHLFLPDAFFVQHAAVTVPKRVIHIGGVVHPYVPGQWVRVRAFIGNRLIKSDRLRIKPSPRGTYGRFSESLSSPVVGVVTVYVKHARTATMSSFGSQRSFAVLDENASFGSTGPFVALIQQRLAALHFYVPQTGVFDGGTALALDAYHRLLHWGTYQSVDGATVSWLLDGLGTFNVRYRHQGKHAEGNLSVQLLALIDGSHVQLIYPISSGKPSTPTIVGSFRVYSKVAGYLPDGMYFSNFFHDAFAIHGYNPAPDYPASHGCMRLPIVDAISVYDWLQIGNAVDVYY